MPYVGEIRAFAWGTLPPGWLPCQGQLMSIDLHQALYALLGTTYGGDGQSTFALPDLRSRAAVGVGAEPLGAQGGEIVHTLTGLEIPGHTHGAQASADPADGSAAGGVLAAAPIWTTPGNAVPLAAVGSVGGGRAHPNLQPYLVLNVCIATDGVFPAST